MIIWNLSSDETVTYLKHETGYDNKWHNHYGMLPLPARQTEKKKVKIDSKYITPIKLTDIEILFKVTLNQIDEQILQDASDAKITVQIFKHLS